MCTWTRLCACAHIQIRDHRQLYNCNGYINLNKPLQETSIIDKGTPLTQVPIHILQRIHVKTRFSAKKNNHTLCLGRNESEKEDIPASTIITLENCFSQRTVFMKTNFLVFSSYLQKDIAKK